MSGLKRACIERDRHGRGCPNYVAVEGKSRCEEHEREHQRRKTTGDGRSRISNRPGWQKLRANVIAEQKGKCARCPAKAVSVHHISGDATDDRRPNLEALCASRVTNRRTVK